jgi:hypothetical protein
LQDKKNKPTGDFIVSMPQLEAFEIASGKNGDYDATILVYVQASDLDALPCASFVSECLAVDRDLHGGSVATLLHATSQKGLDSCTLQS